MTSPATILQQHIDQTENYIATASGLTQRCHRALLDDLTALRPHAGDHAQLLQATVQAYSAIDREQYNRATNRTIPRDDTYQQRSDILGTRFTGLARLERDLQAAL